jgi:uncharacterized SAM-binding protein YcdF (DUF218 family)
MSCVRAPLVRRPRKEWLSRLVRGGLFFAPRLPTASLVCCLTLLFLLGGAPGGQARPGKASKRSEKPEKEPHKVGVIVVLGKGHPLEARPGPGMVERVRTAVEAFREGRAGKLLFCGGYTSGHISEAEEMAIMAMTLGVPRKAVLLENRSMTTGENAEGAANILRPRKFRSALLVSHADHLERALKDFRKAQAAKRIYPLSVPQELPKRSFPEIPAELRQAAFDAVVVHGPDRDPKRQEMLEPGPQVRSLAFTLGAFAAAGLDETPVLLWSKPQSEFSLTMPELMGLAAAAYGFPLAKVLHSSGRRFGPGPTDLFEILAAQGWKKVLVLYPPALSRRLDDILAQYAEKGLEVIHFQAFSAPK